ncbi:MAG TPA: hypothetical protein VLA51_02465, partial [Paracoccaceae bacterium]|nr:hypothetical protein [Paracoccaceae bacterium]
ATRQLLNEEPSEARLLLFILITNMVFAVSWTIKSILVPTAYVSQYASDDLGLYVVVLFLMRTAVLYGFALVVGLLCKFVGSSASLRDIRVGIVWGTFVAAPFGLLAAILGAAMTTFEVPVPLLSSPIFGLLPYWLGLVPFLWFTAAGAAGAARSPSALPLFSIMCMATAFFAALSHL